jgi:nucleoside-diphosphate-sugar epimerase
MKNILVTGGFGFLGSSLLDLLNAAEVETTIYVVDDLSSNVVNPKVFTNNKNIRYEIMSVKAYFEMLKDMRMDFDEIYHLASFVGPAGVLPYGGRIAKQIIEDACDVASYCRRRGAKLVFVSTSEVYGGGQEGLCSEEMACIITPEHSARLEYAIGKLGAEIALLNMQDLDVVIARPFNIAGMRQSGLGGFVLPRFLKAAQDGNALTIFGDGKQVRAFTDVRDVAWGLRLLMSKGVKGEIYNIGAEENKTTIADLARKVISLYDTESHTELRDPKEIFGPTYREANDKYPNSAKIRALGWKPEFNITQIIESAIKDRSSK